MADDRLRELQRAAASSEDTEAVAAHLRQRVRAGDLAWAMLEFAAYLEHPPAQRVLGDEAPSHPEPEPVYVAGGHAMYVDQGLVGNSYCSSKPTKPELVVASQGIPTCRRCQGTSGWRTHQRAAVTKWTELVIANYGLQAGRRVAIATVRAVVIWCQEQQRTTNPTIPIDLTNSPRRSSSSLETVEGELRQLQQSLERAESPDDPAQEARRIVRIVDGATLMGWSDLRGKIRDEVVPWALGLEVAVAAASEEGE